MLDKMPKISVIIPSYNRASMLGMTLESFICQEYPQDSFEIIVADNNSTDMTKDVVLDWQGRAGVRIKYIFEARQGVHYSRNTAAKHADGDILYYTDDDMIADRNLLREIVKVFLDLNIGAATGMIIGRFEASPPKWIKRHLINGCLSLTDKNRTEDLIITSSEGLVYSCHQAVRRDVFFKAGGFNPENTAGAWMGDGETGLNIKIKNMGYKFAYTAKSIIYHMIPRSRTTLKYLINRLGNQGFADSYTTYREHRSRDKIIPLMVKRNTMDLVKSLGLTLVKIVRGNLSWHFIPADIMYFYKRNACDFKLYTDEVFRKIAEIDDWVN